MIGWTSKAAVTLLRIHILQSSLQYFSQLSTRVDIRLLGVLPSVPETTSCGLAIIVSSSNELPALGFWNMRISWARSKIILEGPPL